MFTSRAEYRLTLRADNADRRLTERGLALGIVGPVRAASFAAKMQALNAAKGAAKSLSLTPTEGIRHGLALNRDGQRRSAFELLAYPEIGWAEVARIWPQLGEVSPAISEHVEIDAKYDVYLARQAADVSAFRRDEALVLTGVDYADVPGLSNEARQKLQTVQPRTIGQAARIEAMTPAALGILAAYLRRQARHRRDAKAG
jgi:tRNA uridine 5-carboxymethylaminomethyl modification enzyme